MEILKLDKIKRINLFIYFQFIINNNYFSTFKMTDLCMMRMILIIYDIFINNKILDYEISIIF